MEELVDWIASKGFWYWFIVFFVINTVLKFWFGLLLKLWDGDFGLVKKIRTKFRLKLRDEEFRIPGHREKPSVEKVAWYERKRKNV